MNEPVVHIASIERTGRTACGRWNHEVKAFGSLTNVVESKKNNPTLSVCQKCSVNLGVAE